MNGSLATRRLRKAARLLVTPAWWRAGRHGVVPSTELDPLLDRLEAEPDGVVDVGANRGQFVMLVRHRYANVPIHAFEPTTTALPVLRAVATIAGGTTVHPVAVSDRNGTATLARTASDDNSSLLEPEPAHVRLYPGARVVDRDTITVQPLSDLAELMGGRQLLLKVDVQGTEHEVLSGLGRLASRIRWCIVELSDTGHYRGQRLGPETDALLRAFGFVLVASLDKPHGQRDVLYTRDA